MGKKDSCEDAIDLDVIEKECCEKCVGKSV